LVCRTRNPDSIIIGRAVEVIETWNKQKVDIYVGCRRVSGKEFLQYVREGGIGD